MKTAGQVGLHATDRSHLDLADNIERIAIKQPTQFYQCVVGVMLVFVLWSSLTGFGGRLSWAEQTKASDAVIALEPFKALASKAECADIRNRLFLIDNKLVFWDRQGNCADHAYGQQLFGHHIDQVLCLYHDSLLGPMKRCYDERYRALFETLIANLTKANLGLASEHQVERIIFHAVDR